MFEGFKLRDRLYRLYRMLYRLHVLDCFQGYGAVQLGSRAWGIQDLDMEKTSPDLVSALSGGLLEPSYLHFYCSAIHMHSV